MQEPEDAVIFFENIERIVYDKDVSYMDAVLLFCEDTGIEIEVAASLVQGTLKSKIKIEAEELHFLPKSNTAKLPI
jgi:Phage late-transcription coactivator